MTYHLEQLGDERFQQLCQALLVSELPGVQCLPVGQPDGGRDALRRHHRNGAVDLAIYQVKFALQPGLRTERDAVEMLIRTEKEKVERLIKRGATSYYFLTNISGTSHLDVGSIDKADELLSQTFGIPCYCWWRDDLNRRIDSNSSVKWSFPEIMRATDLLESLISGNKDVESERRGAAIKAYLAFQMKQDAQLKFKQIDLNKSIAELFVDVPACLSIPPNVDDDVHISQWNKFLSEAEIPSLADDQRNSRQHRELTSVGAMQLLVNEDFAERMPQLVIEGAPGQGKSTVTQYLCQVHRLLLLNRSYELSKVAPEHRPASVRVPFRIDLRDYASWLAGRNPFDDDPAAKVPAGSTPLLESFIAAQVHRSTGQSFSVDDLTAVFKTSQVLIVLDGFDEVADIRTRNRIVAEVTDATGRIEQNALSAQIIVTSRPAAFANSPGFPRDEWSHLQILPLTRSVIEVYAKRWLDGRGTQGREKQAVLTVLDEKLGHSHVKDLARNPMQLAILLALISVQGASLPDKRTALYDSYINIFLNRESEKSAVVLEHRELLVQIHRYLAWVLQVEAEESGAGNIGEARLKELLRQYLEINQHPADLVDRLFSGMVERVVALVSRVQGTFEFEVQPLREYFAARYLYDTAPFMPAAISRRAGKPERFDAVARNFYWLNVTRFYAGCYSSGELASLVDGVSELQQSEQFRLIGYPANLGMTLLSDYVFSQHPKIACRLAERVCEADNLYIYLCEEQHKRAGHTLKFPTSCGNSFVDFFKDLLATARTYEQRSTAGRVLKANLSDSERRTYWLSLRDSVNELPLWMELGSHLMVFRDYPLADARDLINEHGELAYFRFAIDDRLDVLQDSPIYWESVSRRIISRGVFLGPFSQLDASSCPEIYLSCQLSALLWPYALEQIKMVASRKATLREAVSEILPRGLVHDRLSADSAFSSDGSLREISHAAETVLDSSFDDLKADPGRWSSLVESCRKRWGGQLMLGVAAANFAEYVSPPSFGKYVLTDDSATLLQRACCAHAEGSAEWWTAQLSNIGRTAAQTQAFALLCAFRWMPLPQLVRHSELVEAVDSIPADQWAALERCIGGMRYHFERRQQEVLRRNDIPEGLSARVASAILPRLSSGSRRLLWRHVLKKYDGDSSSVWRAASELAIEEVAQSATAWSEALGVLQRAHQAGADVHYHQSRADRNAMPADVARKVCSSPRDYPMGLVGASALVLTSESGSAAIPLGKVAARDEWFVDVQ